MAKAAAITARVTATTTKNKNVKTAIVILNWNTKGFLERFLPGILASAGCAPDGTPLGEHAVIVADSASTDGSLEMMAEKFPAVQRIPLDKNYGFTGGYNRALAQLEDFEYFLLLNSDIEVPTGWLEPLVSYMDIHPECGACGPKLHAWQDKGRFEYAGAAGGYLDAYGYPFCRGRVLKRVEQDGGQYDGGVKRVLWVTGACLLVRSRLWKELGGLDDRFFAHMEEIDFCWRLQLAGWQVCVVPQSVVWHVGGGTLPNDSPWKLELNYRNDLLMLRNNLAKTYAAALYKGDAVRAARSGLARAERVITRRMLLDGMSGIVYLLTGRWKALRAVFKAHGAFRRLQKGPTRTELAAWLPGNRTDVKGLYPKWIVPQALLCGEKIFDIVHRFDAENK